MLLLDSKADVHATSKVQRFAPTPSGCPSAAVTPFRTPLIPLPLLSRSLYTIFSQQPLTLVGKGGHTLFFWGGRVGSIPANPEAQNVTSFRVFDLK